MADFKQAVEWMKEGKKVRRPYFNNAKHELYLTREKGTGAVKVHNEAYQLRDYDYDATDWEIYEEDNWNTFEHGWEYVPSLYEDRPKKYTLIKLKEKIIDDFSKVEQVRGINTIYNKKDVDEIINKRFGF